MHIVPLAESGSIGQASMSSTRLCETRWKTVDAVTIATDITIIIATTIALADYGEYTVTATGTGNYQGTVSDTFVLYEYRATDLEDLNTKVADEIADQGSEADLNLIDTSLITSMSGLFRDITTFNGDISRWNVSSVTNMAHMFVGASAFNQDLAAWSPHLEGRTVLMTDAFKASGVTTPPSWYTTE